LIGNQTGPRSCTDLADEKISNIASIAVRDLFDKKPFSINDEISLLYAFIVLRGMIDIEMFDKHHTKSL
jgi:hypothetical protein